VHVPARINKTQANLAKHSNTFLPRFNVHTHIKIYDKTKGIEGQQDELDEAKTELPADRREG